MKYGWIDEFLLAKNGVTKDLKKEWNWIRYQIGGKLFAAICLDDKDIPYYITLKLEPSEGEFLRQQYEDIVPGYYMDKRHWNSVKPDGNVPDDLLKDMLDKSYQLVLAGFSKKKQKNITRASCCGTKCWKCGYYGIQCKGCNECLGKVFYIQDNQTCAIYECAIHNRGLTSCGSCSNVPCNIWHDTRDPGFSDEEFEKNILERVSNLRETTD